MLPKESIVSATDTFALDLYKQLQTTPGNLTFSPASIYIALSMTAAGARSKTAEQMAQVLRAPINSAKFHESMSAQLRAWNEANRDETLRVVNRLYGQDGFSFRESFLAVTRDQYGASLEIVDFGSDPERARTEINHWVENQTEHKIKDLIQEGQIDSITTLVLLNAVYFLGKWVYAFEPSQTYPEVFLLESGARKKIPMMHQTSEFIYREHKKVQILELPYHGYNISMTVFLPRDPKGLARLERHILDKGLAEWRVGHNPSEVFVTLPKFRVEQGLSLRKELSYMGMPDAFNEGLADFTGMYDRALDGNLYISEVVHKAFVDVDEKGTEAAAATAVIMDMECMPAESAQQPVIFRADHPFIFIIQDKKTGIILFMGRVMDPAS